MQTKNSLIKLIKEDLKELENNLGFTPKEMLQTRTAIYTLRNLLVEVYQEKNLDNSKAKEILHKWLEELK